MSSKLAGVRSITLLARAAVATRLRDKKRDERQRMVVVVQLRERGEMKSCVAFRSLRNQYSRDSGLCIPKREKEPKFHFWMDF